jgi:hypothetical protein
MIPWESSSRRGKGAGVAGPSDHGRRFFERDKVEEKEVERKRKGQPNQYRRQDTSKGGTLWVLCGTTPLQLDRLGRHCP